MTQTKPLQIVFDIWQATNTDYRVRHSRYRVSITSIVYNIQINSQSVNNEVLSTRPCNCIRRNLGFNCDRNKDSRHKAFEQYSFQSASVNCTLRTTSSHSLTFVHYRNAVTYLLTYLLTKYEKSVIASSRTLGLK